MLCAGVKEQHRLEVQGVSKELNIGLSKQYFRSYMVQTHLNRSFLCLVGTLGS